jgi:hypothetical protein
MIREVEVLAALPPSGFVRSYVEYAMQRTDANCAYHLGAALSIITQTVPLDYCVPYASPLWGNMFTLIVGDSSKSRKTASINIAQRILREAIPESVGEVPGSQEGLYESLRSQQRQLIVYGEFGEFLAKAEEGYMMALKTAYTNLFDGIPIGRALANSRKGAVQDPRLSLLCGVATDLLERHTEQADWTGGFLARFLTLFGEPEREFATPPTDDPVQRRSLVTWVANMANPPQPPGACLWLDAAGQQMWSDWYESMRPMREGANRRVAAACSRSTSIAAKLALLLAWDVGTARSGNDWHVGVVELESALKIASLHLQSVIELGERVTGSRDMRDRRAVLRAISKAPTPLGVIIREAELLKRRVNEILDSLMEERTIATQKIGDETCYFLTPQMHARLVQMAREYDETDSLSDPTMGQVLTLRPPRQVPETPLVPVSDALNDDDIDWATFDG